jgi:hypothetical protein
VAAPRRRGSFPSTKRTKSLWGSLRRTDRSCNGSTSVWDGSFLEVLRAAATAVSEARRSTAVPAGTPLRRVLLAVSPFRATVQAEAGVPSAGGYRGLRRGPLYHSPVVPRNIDTRTSEGRAGTSRARRHMYVMRNCSIGSHGPPCPPSLRRMCLPPEVGQTPTAPPGRATHLALSTSRTPLRGGLAPTSCRGRELQ